MTTDDIYKILTGLVVVFGAIGSLYTLARSANRDTVDDLRKLVDTQSKMIEKLEKKVSVLEHGADERDKRILELERENRLFEDWVNRLIAQLIEAGMTPVHSMRTNE